MTIAKECIEIYRDSGATFACEYAQTNATTILGPEWPSSYSVYEFADGSIVIIGESPFNPIREATFEETIRYTTKD